MGGLRINHQSKYQKHLKMTMKVIGMSGQYIGKIDGGSPAEAAGLCEGDRIVEVNLFEKYSDVKYFDQYY